MLDLKLIRAQPEILDQALQRRGKPTAAAEILALDANHRGALTELQICQTNRNTLAKQFGEAKRNGEDTTSLSAESDRLKAEITRWEKEVEAYDRDLKSLLSS